MIGGVIFDAFGTTLHIGRRTNPYHQLLREGRRQGLSLGPEVIRKAMTVDLSFEEFADAVFLPLTHRQRAELASTLQLELESIRAFPDTLEAIERLRKAGLKVGICSNLSKPYGSVVRALLPGLDAVALSYELGVMKPDPLIYQAVCDQFGFGPTDPFSCEGRVVMIGDSQRCGKNGPRVIGVMGYYLARHSRGAIRDLSQFVDLVLDHNRHSAKA